MNAWLGLDHLLFFIIRIFLAASTRTTHLPQSAEELNLTSDKPVVYVLRDSSITDLVALERTAASMGLPSPRTPLTSHTLSSASFHVYRRQSWYNRQRVSHDPPRLERLIAAVSETPDNDVQLVPVSLFWGRRPDKELSLWKILFSDNWSPPGFLKKFIVVITQGRQLYMQFSPPLSLKEAINGDLPPEIARRKVLRILRVHFRRQREAAIGPDLSHRRTLVNTLVNSVSVQAAIKATADAENHSIERVSARARSYAMEIAADYSHAVIRFLEVLLSWVWNRVYAGIRIYNIETLRETARDHTIVYVPCHRSHADYLLLSYLVYRNGLVPPHIAAGINLNMPIIGPILRRGGAFFMRRSFKDNVVYQAVFDEYMHSVLSRGFSVEYFVEGGRSRSGRMLQPKTGMLAMTLRSYLRDTEKPLAFVPVYIGYEKVIESNTYIGELHGEKKRKETVGGVLRSLSILRSKFGQVHVNFGEPLRIADFLDQQIDNWRSLPISGNQLPDWLRPTVNKLANELASRINAATVVNPVNLLSHALLATPKHTMDASILNRHLSLLLALFEKAPYSENTAIACGDPDAVIDYGIENDFIYRISHSLGDLVSTSDVTALQISYMRNNTLHLLVLPGIISSLLLNARKIPRSRLHKLIALIYPFFQSEYFLHWNTETNLDQAIENCLAVLTDQRLAVVEEDHLIGAPLHTIEADLLEQLSESVRQPLERFYLTVRILVQQGSGTLTTEELLLQALLSAERLSLLHEFNSPEFADKDVLRNFIRQLCHQDLIHCDDATGKLSFGDQLESLDFEARRILNANVRHAIQRLTPRDVSLSGGTSAIGQ